eukprot:SAG22_NODE_5375_length_1025_cov_3.896328_1_plen_306_part_10
MFASPGAGSGGALMCRLAGLRTRVAPAQRAGTCAAAARAFSSRAVVCKFGGTSVATVESITEIKEILALDSDRRYVIVSAPGKRFDDDIKVTDLLYQSHELAKDAPADDYARFFDEKIGDRFRHLSSSLAPDADPTVLDNALEAAKAKISDLAQAGEPPDFAASRGEALCGRMFADVVGYEFVDPASGDFIQFGADGVYDRAATSAAVASCLGGVPKAVVPGFYGSSLKDPSGVQTFTRGGSDVTGAIVAAGAAASGAYSETVYENWTDVDGCVVCLSVCLSVRDLTILDSRAPVPCLLTAVPTWQ